MDLRELIPAAESISGPILNVVGSGDSGLSGIVSQLQNQDLGSSVSALAGSMQASLASEIPDASGSPFGGALGALSNVSSLATVPDGLFGGIDDSLSRLDSVLTRVPELVDLLSNTANNIEAAKNGDLGPIVQQAEVGLNSVLTSVTGPDLAGFDDWRAYLQELADTIRPIIAAGGTPDQVRDQLLALAVGRIRNTIFALAPEISALRDDGADLLNGLLPDIPGFNLETLHSDVSGSLAALQTAAETGVGDMDPLITDYQTKVALLTDQIHLALDALQPNLTHTLLSPGGVTEVAGRELDRVLATSVDDYSNVVARVEAFFTAIEETVDSVDLSSITDGVNGFFDTIQSAVGTIDPAAIEQEIDGISTEIEELLNRVQEMLITLTSRIQGWLSELSTTVESLVGELGDTNAEGQFHFFFEEELNELYQRIDSLIQGDPARPDAFSVQKSLGDFQQTFVGLTDDVESQLMSLADQLESAKDELSENLDGVRVEIESVDPQAVMEQATSALEEAFQAIGGLEFDPVVDPIIAELEEARDALAEIDLSSLNDILKNALRMALNAIQTSDFDGEITDVLLKELDELLEYPRQVLNSIAEKINELLARVVAISPESLLAPVQEHIDLLLEAVDIDLSTILKPPLKSAIGQLTGVLEDLNPAQFIEPLRDGHQTLTNAVDQLQPETLLQPVQSQIDGLVDSVATLDLGSQLTEVNAVFGNINSFLDSINPSELLAPINEPFDTVFDTLENIAPGTLLAPLSDIMDQIAGITDEIPDVVITQIQALYDEALARVDGLDPAALFSAVREPMEAFHERFQSLQPTSLLTQIQQDFNQVQTAVVAADSRDETDFSIRFETTAPTLLFASVISRYEPLQARFTGVIDSLDPASLQERYEQARACMEELLPRAIRDDISASQLQTLLGLMNPAQWITRLDEIYQRIVDKLQLLSPSLIIDPLTETYQELRDVVGAVDIGRVVSAIETVLEQVGEIVSSISLETIFGPILSLVDRLKGVVAALDPGILIDGLSERYENLLGLLDDIGLEVIIDAIQAAWQRLYARISELFDLENLLQPLIAIFDAISALLGGLDAGELVGVLDEKLDKIRDELEEALNRTGTAFKEMLAAVPLDGGSSSASVSVGV